MSYPVSMLAAHQYLARAHSLTLSASVGVLTHALINCPLCLTKRVLIVLVEKCLFSGCRFCSCPCKNAAIRHPLYRALRLGIHVREQDTRGSLHASFGIEGEETLHDSSLHSLLVEHSVHQDNRLSTGVNGGAQPRASVLYVCMLESRIASYCKQRLIVTISTGDTPRYVKTDLCTAAKARWHNWQAPNALGPARDRPSQPPAS
jgi:hypothetical protein